MRCDICKDSPAAWLLVYALAGGLQEYLCTRHKDQRIAEAAKVRVGCTVAELCDGCGVQVARVNVTIEDETKKLCTSCYTKLYKETRDVAL